MGELSPGPVHPYLSSTPALCALLPTRCTPQGAAVEAGHLILQAHLADYSAVGISPGLDQRAPPLWS